MTKSKFTPKPSIENKVDENKPTREALLTKLCMFSNYRAGVLHESFNGNMSKGINASDVMTEIGGSLSKIKEEDYTDIDLMYLSQAKSLEWLFVTLARKASFAELMPHYQTYMNLAMKAQAQSRATLQALVERHNPKQVAFVKQANIASGHQQINNGSSELEKISDAPNKLLEEPHYGGTYLDRAAKRKAKTSHPKVETLGKVNRSKDDSRQG